jgi:flavin prenyltransferase
VSEKRRIIIGISGASGAVYGIRLLEVLRALPGVESHLILTRSAKLNIAMESDISISDVEALADVVHSEKNVGASIASGSFRTEGMIIAPCSMKTLSAIVHSYSDNLVTRAADVVLKERRRLVLVPRETPLHTGHCKLFYEASVIGAVLCPPVPAFYNKPQTISDVVDGTVGRILDLFDIDANLIKRWNGMKAQGGS